MNKAIVMNAHWATNGKAVISLSNGETVWLSPAQLENFGVAVPQSMRGGELSYRWHAIGDTLVTGGVVTKERTLLDINSVSFFSEELNAQAFDANAKIFEKQATKALETVTDLRTKNRAALNARLQAVKDASNANATPANAPANAAPAGAPVLDDNATEE